MYDLTARNTPKAMVIDFSNGLQYNNADSQYRKWHKILKYNNVSYDRTIIYKIPDECI